MAVKMTFNLKILAAVLSETEGKKITAETARHIAEKPENGNNARRLLAALPAYKLALQNECEKGQEGFGALEYLLKHLERKRQEKAAEKAQNSAEREAKRTARKAPKIAIIGGEEVRFDLATKRKLRYVRTGSEKFEYLGVGVVKQVSGWMKKSFPVGTTAMFWRKKHIPI